MKMSEKKMSRDETIIQMRKDRATYSKIMSFVQCSQQVVYRTLFRAGMINTGRRSKLSEEQKSEIIQLRTDDPTTWTYMGLSVRFQVSCPVINKILRNAGLTKSA